MAAVVASAPPPPGRHAALPPTASGRLPAHLRRSRDRPHRLHHSVPSPTTDWTLEQRIRESLGILDLMESQSISPEPEILASLLRSCAEARSLRLGRIVHDKATRTGLLSHPLVANSLVLLYGRCGQLGTARLLFEKMPARNVVSWTTIISVYHRAGFPHDALDLYRSMQTVGGVRPNAFTYSVALNCCASVQDFELGVRIHEELVQDGCESDEFIVVALIDMYAKCGCVADARQVFDRMTKQSVEACTAMIEGYNGNGEGKKAIDVMRRMFQNGISGAAAAKLGFASMARACVIELALRQGQEIHARTIKVGQYPGSKALTALAELYEKCDKMVAAKHIFDSLVVKEMDLWVRMVGGFVRNKMYRDSLKLYTEMMSLDLNLNPFLVALAIKSCIEMPGLQEGKQIHCTLVKVTRLVDESVVDSLIEFYRSFGEYAAAQKLEKQS
ncbi:putative pentatricopeptide repeat-containing protein At3g13770, mitochondrial [Zingiber officinale]|uniref:Pentatricopeptide repeat-containing protein n=1 Tax=Zingiber officinale TaxID=94328 RepID=A0A8J5EMN3_ZINOF|nr:putative pentatricopeptide repeat-containing protein At3g13770, mitochondrial [Zingiber officinale]XP_042448744.1 putative pentatricopeptide repeat-containing protein At3g13770, mitochondrial [Zingiber officinale]KAG6469063.1 hypothetical protein ZIOFF_073761 [Zingiber officinale]